MLPVAAFLRALGPGQTVCTLHWYPLHGLSPSSEVTWESCHLMSPACKIPILFDSPVGSGKGTISVLWLRTPAQNLRLLLWQDTV